MTAPPTPPTFETVAELLEQLGDISPHRIRLQPAPGTATERDLIALNTHSNRLYELVDGVLVEKVMCYPESSLACDLVWLLRSFLEQHKLGFLAGEAAAMRLMPGLVRIPDISFVSWDQLPTRERPTEPIANLAPALAVEVLSEGNTPKEMNRKVREHFLSGVQLVWFVDMKRRTVTVYTAPDQWVVLNEDQVLEGGDVLAGLALPIRQIFAEVPRIPSDPRKGKGSRRTGKGKPRKKSG